MSMSMSTHTVSTAASQPAQPTRQVLFLPRGRMPALRSIDVERLNAFALHRLLRSKAAQAALGPAPHASASAVASAAEEDGDWVLVAAVSDCH